MGSKARAARAVRSITLVLSYPPAELSPNGRYHWAAVHRASAAAKMEAWARAYEQLGLGHGKHGKRPLRGAVRALVTVYAPTRAKHDDDNFRPRMKPYWDGMVAAGLLEDDSEDKLKVEYVWRVKRKGEEPRVEVTLTEARR